MTRLEKLKKFDKYFWFYWIFTIVKLFTYFILTLPLWIFVCIGNAVEAIGMFFQNVIDRKFLFLFECEPWQAIFHPKRHKQKLIEVIKSLEKL